MKNGTIILWDKRKMNKGFRLFVSKMICWVTKAEVTHSAIWLNGMVYEQEKIARGKDGLIITREGYTSIVKSEYRLEYVRELKDHEVMKMEKYIRDTYSKYGYNFLKLLSLALVAPLKGLFRKLKWVPFDKPWFGEVCSVMPDEAYKSIGIDLLPGEHEGYTAPGDYLKCVRLGTLKKA